MGYTYDLNTQIGQMRLLMPDNDKASYLFEDEEYDAFLVAENGNVRNATALALEVTATSQALLIRSIRIGKLSVDSATQYDRLTARANSLRGQSDTGSNPADAANAAFDSAAFRDTPLWAW